MLTYYHTNLPHIQPKGAVFFITFRLEGSIPKVKLKKWETEYFEQRDEISKIVNKKDRNLALFNHRKKSFAIYDSLIYNIGKGPHYLKNRGVMQVVKNELHRFDKYLYNLIAYSIMSNHVHILMEPININLENKAIKDIYNNHSELSYILKRLKGATARYANQKLDRVGRFWHKDNFDIYIRNDKMLLNVISYILENPVKAKIVKSWDEYDGNYLGTSS